MAIPKGRRGEDGQWKGRDRDRDEYINRERRREAEIKRAGKVR